MNSNLDIDSSNMEESKDELIKQAGQGDIVMNKANSEQSDFISISLPVVPMKTLLETYTQWKVNANSGAENTDYYQTRNRLREMIKGDSDSTDSFYSDELQDQINYNQDKLKCEESVSGNAMQICKKLENLFINLFWVSN